jgi:hypothetical protein
VWKQKYNSTGVRKMSKSSPELRTENKKLKRTLKVWRGIAERNMEDANASFLEYKKLLKEIKKIKKAKKQAVKENE